MTVKASAQLVDVDLFLVDDDSGECIVGFGCRNSAPCPSLSAPCIIDVGWNVSFGGAKDVAPVLEEAIIFDLRQTLAVVVKARKRGT